MLKNIQIISFDAEFIIFDTESMIFNAESIVFYCKIAPEELDDLLDEEAVLLQTCINHDGISIQNDDFRILKDEFISLKTMKNVRCCRPNS